MIPFTKKRMSATSSYQGRLSTEGGAGGGGGGSYDTITWTTIPDLDPSDREIYVSDSTGTDNYLLFDSTHGSITHPYATIACGRSWLRDGYGDRLWLKKGDTFTSQNLTSFNKSGASPTRPMIIGAYGSGARPVVDPEASAAFNCSSAVSDIWVVGVKFRSSTYNGTSDVNAFQFQTSADNILIEDCEISNCSVGAYWAGSNRHTNASIRGCQIFDCYSTGGNAMGIIIGACDGVLVEWSTFDDCGWKAGVSGSTPTIYLHSIYIQGGTVTAGGPGCTDVEVSNCFNLNTDGMQLRGGGTCTGNVVSRTRVGYTLGIGAQQQQPTGATVVAEDNVCLESQVAAGLACAYRIGGIGFASSFKRNIAGRSIGNQTSEDVKGIWFDTPGDATLFATATVDFDDNIIFHAGYWSWSSGITYSTGCLDFSGNDWQLNPLIGSDNHCFRCDATGVLANQVASGNNYWSSPPESGSSTYWGQIGGANTPIATWVGSSNLDDATATFDDHTTGFYTDPERTLGQYYVSLGNSTLGSETLNHAAFCALLRAQTKDTWDDTLTAPAVRAYIVEGFTPV